MRNIKICNREIGPGHAPWIIAELGINHNGDPQQAEALVHAAANVGADAVKLQVFQPSQFISRNSPYIDIFKKTALNADAVKQLLEVAKSLHICLFPTVFDEISADICAKLDVPALKIASGDLTHIPLIRHTAAIGVPMIISTGGGTMGDIANAIDAVYTTSPDAEVALLHCVSNYPTEAGDANLACMQTMSDAFNVPVGFSDHSDGFAIPIAAATLGASMIEKHFTIERSASGPDHALSANPDIMKSIVVGARVAFDSIGHKQKAPIEPPDFIPEMRRSVTANVDIPAGTQIKADMLAIKRPGKGISPVRFGDVVGMKAIVDIDAETTLEWSLLN